MQMRPGSPCGFYLSKNNQGGWSCLLSVKAPPTRAIVFKGGGARGLAYNTFLNGDESRRDSLEEVGGSSAGAVAAVCYAMPFPPGERAKALEKFDMSNMSDIRDSAGQELKGWRWYWRAFSNLVTKGGLHTGEKLTNMSKQGIWENTHAGLKRFIDKQDSENEKIKILGKLAEIGLVRKCIFDASGKLIDFTITDEITFKHFHYLATNYKESGFKDLFIMSTRDSDKSSVKFDYHSDETIYRAVRWSVSMPLYYTKEKDSGGNYYLDAGCANNCPVTETSPSDYPKEYPNFLKKIFNDIYKKINKNQADKATSLQSEHSFSDMTSLVVRVEYKSEMDFLWNTKLSLFDKMTKWLKDNTIGRFSRWAQDTIVGTNMYARDEEVTQTLKEYHAPQVLQLYDTDVGITEFNLSEEKRAALDKQATKDINQYYSNHQDERVPIQYYASIAEMPKEALVELRSILVERGDSMHKEVLSQIADLMPASSCSTASVISSFKENKPSSTATLSSNQDIVETVEKNAKASETSVIHTTKQTAELLIDQPVVIHMARRNGAG
ncbi:MAG: patatin-like phospholipase family protein [Gammaproteobacteria bacterium]